LEERVINEILILEIPHLKIQKNRLLNYLPMGRPKNSARGVSHKAAKFETSKACN
jgi:hypothetical protein